MDNIQKQIQELKKLMNKDYLDKLDNKGQEELYNSLVELVIPLLDYSYLREKQLRKNIISNRLWSAWRTRQIGNDK